MATPALKKYLATANQVIGKRTPARAAYDREVLRWLNITKDIRAAVTKANEKHPREAVAIDASNEADLQAHYDYLKTHDQILTELVKRRR